MNNFSFMPAISRFLMIVMAMVLPLVGFAQDYGHVGSIDDFTYNSETFSQIRFGWTDKEGVDHISDMTQEATDPEHIKALVKEVYSNRAIPGTKYIKYFDLDPDATVGSLGNPGPLKTYDPAVDPKAQVLYPAYPALGLDEESYAPDIHGTTALLVEINVPEFMEYPTNPEHFNMATYIEKAYYEKTGQHYDGIRVSPEWILDNTDIVKSVRVLTERTHIKEGPNPGYLFNIDQQLKHFFIVLKGKPRRLDRHNSGVEVLADIFSKFEQIAPRTDYHPEMSTLDYLRAGQKYQVIHDCSSVFSQSHFFSMNRVPHVGDFTAEENVFIYIPEARMTWWDDSMPYISELKANHGLLAESSNRDAYGTYTYYNLAYSPFLFLYNINLQLEGRYSPEKPNHHDVKLTWNSSFTDITQAVEDEVEEEFYIFRVDESGHVSPAPILYGEVDFMVPADQVHITRVVRDENGYMQVRSFKKNVSVHLFEPHNPTEEPSRMIGYMVSGRIADKDYVPVFSNNVEHMMYSTQLKIVAEIDQERTKSEFSIVGMNNNYVHAVKMINHPDVEREIEKNDLTVGSRFYLMRADSNNPGSAQALGYLEITSIRPTVNAVGDDIYEYAWEIRPMSSYLGGKLSAVALSGTFESERSGDLNNDLRAMVKPADGSNVYAEFLDMFSVTVSGNAHPGQYSYYFDFDPAGAALPDGTPIEKSSSNTVAVMIPKSSLKGGLLTYDRSEIELDAQLRHLPANSTKADMMVTDNAQIHEYEVYLQSQSRIAHLVRNKSGRYEILAKSPDTKDEIIVGTVQSGKAEVPCYFSAKPGEKFYGRIVATSGSTYGVDYSPAVKGPSVNIDGLTIYRVIDAEVDDGRHYVGHKNLSHDKDIQGYETYYHHYNIWRRVDTKVSFAETESTGEETLIRSHKSRPHVKDGVDWSKDFNTFEQFYINENTAADDVHFHSDGFVMDDAKDVPDVTYTVRVYVEIYEDGPSSGSRYAAPRFALAQAVSSEFSREQVTGVEDAVADMASGLKASALGQGILRIDGQGSILISNIAGVVVDRISDGQPSRTVALSPGLYIITNGEESVKAQVR